jgi:enoyl-CoA hydratase
MAEKIAQNAPIAVRATKKAINEGMQVDVDTAIGMEAELFGSCFDTMDQKNAMKAFLEKQKPAPFENK